MIKRLACVAVLVGSLGVSGCAPTYTLVRSGPQPVAKDAFTVSPSQNWNRIPKTANVIAIEESWTKNGPMLDSISFVGGLAEGQALIVQKKKDDQQVPPFRSDMSPNDLVSMTESYYRVRGGVTVFNVTGVEPAQFLGSNGVKFDFDYVGSDSFPKKGRCFMAVVGGKLYLMKLEGAASHYFASSSTEFDSMAKSAMLAKR